MSSNPSVTETNLCMLYLRLEGAGEESIEKAANETVDVAVLETNKSSQPDEDDEYVYDEDVYDEDDPDEYDYSENYE